MPIRLLCLELLLLCVCLNIAAPASAEFWDSDFVNSLYSFVRYKGYFVSLFQHATKPNYFFYSPLVVLDKDSGKVFNNYLRGVQEIDFNVVMSTDGLRTEVLQHLTNSKKVQSPQVQMIPMESVKFTYASALRRGSMKLDLESTSVPSNHLPNSLPIKFYSFSEAEARNFLSAVQTHPAILDQVVLEYTITQRRTAEKQVEVKAEYIASTAIFAQLSTMTAPGTVRYLTARDANSIASQSFSSISARVVRSQEYIEGPDELRLTQIVQQLLTRDAARWSELSEAAQQSVFWDPAFARPDEVTRLLNRVYERESGSSRLLKVREDEQQQLEQQSAQTTACYVFQCASSNSGTGRRLEAKQKLTEDQMKQFLNERQIEVEYTGKMFIVKNMQLFRVNTAEFQGGQTIATSSVQHFYLPPWVQMPSKCQVTKKQAIHTLKLKTDSELPDDSEAVSRAACSNLPYAYKGCYEDVDTARDLDGYSQLSGDMQVRQCYDLCSSRGFVYFGLQAGGTCNCGGSYGRYRMRPDAECDAPCAGDSGQRCGGHRRNSVFGVNRPATSVPAGPSSTASAPDNVYNSTRFDYRGCFANPEGGQQPWLMEQSDLMTVGACYNYCSGEQRQKIAWFSLRTGTECHCRQRAPPRLKRLSDSECRTACAGDPRQACGSPAAISLYAFASLREGVASQQLQNWGNDWGTKLAATASALSDGGGNSKALGGSTATAYRQLGCPSARDAFIELSAFQTPGLVPADCAAFCRADDASVKYFRIGGGDAGGGWLSDSGGFGSGLGFGGSGGVGGGGGGGASCSCLYAMMSDSRIGFGSGQGSSCGGYKYFAIDGR